MSAKHPSTWERLTESAIAYADCDAEDDLAWARARDRLRKSALAYQEDCELRREMARNLAAIFRAEIEGDLGGVGQHRGLLPANCAANQ